jgi:hypothetical protein
LLEDEFIDFFGCGLLGEVHEGSNKSVSLFSGLYISR